ncbi:phage holin [Bacillus coagulans]|uniref:phage holin n=1 Tax=Heyndrickxia coagulans TaxID=1398 RepID=UPI001378DCC6|nr:phage holin [Heyndrickxia coagulans]NCG67757.1 phage holin [Heyndrickxia coagulans]
MKMDRGTLIRTIVLFIALLNQILVSCGLYKIPGTAEQQTEVLSTLFTLVTSVVAWFKNNYVTAKGKAQKEVLKRNNLTK